MTDTTQPAGAAELLAYLLTQYERAVSIHAQVRMDTDEDRQLHADAVTILRRAAEPVARYLDRAARTPLTVAGIPAGQGPASLFLATVGMRDGGVTATPGAGRGDLWLWFKDEDGTLLMLERAPSPTSRADFVARWEHLAATLPHVTDEETP